QPGRRVHGDVGRLHPSFTMFRATGADVVRPLGSRGALIFGTSGYTLFFLDNLLTTWYTMVPASVYLSFTSSLMWVGHGTYLMSAAFSHATENKLHSGQLLGRFNGEFWGMYASTQARRNLISLVVLGNDKDGGAAKKNLLFTVFLGCMVVGIVLMCLLSRRDEKRAESGRHEPQERSFLHDTSRPAVTPLADLRMLLLAPLLAYYGLQGICMSSVVAGRLTSDLPSSTFIVSTGAVLQAGVLLWLLFFYSPMGGLLGSTVALVVGTEWGFGLTVTCFVLCTL
ncbi:hypothetical protein ZWY2020_057895, partial [Hordeum vulgare]